MDPNQPAPQQPVEPVVQPPVTPDVSNPTVAPQPVIQPQAYGPTPQQQPYQAVPAQNPGSVFGILSIVFPIIGLGLIGLILGIVGLKKSKAVGQSNTPAVVGIILSALSIVVGIFFIIGVALGISNVAKHCSELGPGTHYVGSTTYTCS